MAGSLQKWHNNINVPQFIHTLGGAQELQETLSTGVAPKTSRSITRWPATPSRSTSVGRGDRGDEQKSHIQQFEPKLEKIILPDVDTPLGSFHLTESNRDS